MIMIISNISYPRSASSRCDTDTGGNGRAWSGETHYLERGNEYYLDVVFSLSVRFRWISGWVINLPVSLRTTIQSDKCDWHRRSRKRLNYSIIDDQITWNILFSGNGRMCGRMCIVPVIHFGVKS